MPNRRQRRSAAQATSQPALNAFTLSASPQSFDMADEMPQPSAQEVGFATQVFEAIRECPSTHARLRELCDYFDEIRGWTKEKTIVVVVANALPWSDLPPPNTDDAETRHFTPFQGVAQTLSADVGQVNLEGMD